jgi:hypothetical protein
MNVAWTDPARMLTSTVVDSVAAQMRLRVRSVIADAEQAEQRCASLDADAAREQLLQRLQPMIDERRRRNDAEVREERERQEARIAEAQRQADQVVSDARRAAHRVAPPPPPVIAPMPLSPSEHPAIPAIPVPPAFAGPVIVEQTPVPLPPMSPAVALPVASVAPAPPPAAALDPHELAAVVAAAVAAAMARPNEPMERRSSWRDAMHVDVALLGLAIVIVVVVILTWMAS